jgi:hypothetical protein
MLMLLMFRFLIIVFPYSNANDMHVTQDLNTFGEIIAHAQCSVDEKKNYIYIFRVYHIRINHQKKIKYTPNLDKIAKYNYILSLLT